MINNKHLEKLNFFFSKELTKNLSQVAIFQHENGSYELFNKYVITETPAGVEVILAFTYGTKVFSSLRNAVTWCIFDKRNKFSKTSRIEYLDKMISGIDLSIKIHKRIALREKDSEMKLIAVAKLTEDQCKKKRMNREMSEYITESKIWQTRQFAQK